jgi:hypothetical protein
LAQTSSELFLSVLRIQFSKRRSGKELERDQGLFINARQGEVAAARAPRRETAPALAPSQSNRFVNKPSHFAFFRRPAPRQAGKNPTENPEEPSEIFKTSKRDRGLGGVPE